MAGLVRRHRRARSAGDEEPPPSPPSPQRRPRNPLAFLRRTPVKTAEPAPTPRAPAPALDASKPPPPHQNTDPGGALGPPLGSLRAASPSLSANSADRASESPERALSRASSGSRYSFEGGPARNRSQHYYRRPKPAALAAAAVLGADSAGLPAPRAPPSRSLSSADSSGSLGSLDIYGEQHSFDADMWDGGEDLSHLDAGDNIDDDVLAEVNGVPADSDEPDDEEFARPALAVATPSSGAWPAGPAALGRSRSLQAAQPERPALGRQASLVIRRDDRVLTLFSPGVDAPTTPISRSHSLRTPLESIEET